MDAADPRAAMLAEMGACAYRLGMAFGAEAEGARTTADKLQYFQLFDRCFFAVRVGLALELRLRREGRAAVGPSPGAERHAREDERAEPVEQEARDGDAVRDRDRDQDREREAEGASLPLLLRTLRGVSAEAAALPGPPPAALPTLQDLLARFSTDVPAASASGGGRLAGSAASLGASASAQVLIRTLAPPKPSPAQGRARPRPGIATGPPPS